MSAHPDDRLLHAAVTAAAGPNAADTLLHRPRTRVTGITIPEGTVHHDTGVFCLSWDVFDRLGDDWEYRAWTVTDPDGSERFHESKRKDVMDGFITAHPPTNQDRPRTMLCPRCKGEATVVTNLAAFMRDPALDERDVRCEPCPACDGRGRLPRPDGPSELPVSREDFVAGLTPDSDEPTDVPF